MTSLTMLLGSLVWWCVLVAGAALIVVLLVTGWLLVVEWLDNRRAKRRRAYVSPYHRAYVRGEHQIVRDYNGEQRVVGCAASWQEADALVAELTNQHRRSRK